MSYYPPSVAAKLREIDANMAKFRQRLLANFHAAMAPLKRQLDLEELERMFAEEDAEETTQPK